MTAELCAMAAVPVGSTVLVAVVCFFCIGLPIGLIIGMIQSAEMSQSSASVNHIAKLTKRINALSVHLLTNGRIFVGLAPLKIKLLLKKPLLKLELLIHQTLLKWEGDARCEVNPEQCSKDSCSDAGEKEFVCHKPKTATSVDSWKDSSISRIGD